MPNIDLSEDDPAYMGGKRAGDEWVTKGLKGADKETLTRLSEFWEQLGHDGGRWFSDESCLSAFTTAERLYFVLAPDDEGDRDAAESFWEYVAWPTDMSDISASFVEGFVVGSLEAWGRKESAGQSS